MRLFEAGVREDHAPKRHNETTFALLDRWAKPEASSVREILEAWFQLYPAEHQPDLKARFQADFEAAFFELLNHQVLLQAGYTVDIEPETVGRATRPDFRAERATNVVFLEATVASDRSAEERRRAAVEEALYDAINTIESPDFFIRVRTLTFDSKEQPIARRAVAFLERELKAADWESAVSAIAAQGLDGLPKRRFKDGSVVLEVEFIPKTSAARGRPGIRPIGMYPIRSKWGDTVPTLQKAFAGKARRYGNLSAPFVVAINSTSEWGSDRWEIESALYGQEEVTTGDGAPRLVRVGNAAFSSTDTVVNERVAAVLAGTAWPWGLPQSALTIYHNPWAQHPLPIDALPFPQVVLRNSRFVRIPGVPLHTFLGLPDSWPHDVSDSDDNAGEPEM